jgi:4-hydroxybenzoate polyprenyltransferase
MVQQALWKFIAERFPLPVTVPFVAVLVAGTAKVLGVGLSPRTLTGLVSVFVAFLMLRIIDDLSDLEFDKQMKPARGLCSGAIPEARLRQAFWVVVILFLLGHRGSAGETLVWGSLIGYSLFYRIKARLPFFLRTLGVNALFLLVPQYVAVTSGMPPRGEPWLLGVFFWFSVIAHEFTHSLAEDGRGNALYERHFSRRTQAILGAIGYGLALLAAGFWAIRSDQGTFLFALLPWTMVVLCLCVRLIRNPVPENAKPFFVQGFLFFLVPLLLYLLGAVTQEL